ncbi:MAG: hypothetical protein PVF85_13155 [Anaerolineales bacterium]
MANAHAATLLFTCSALPVAQTPHVGSTGKASYLLMINRRMVAAGKPFVKRELGTGLPLSAAF